MSSKKKNNYQNQEVEKNEVNEPMPSYSEKPLDFQQVWLMFQEVKEMFKETDRKFAETDKQFKETDIQFKETDKKINQVLGLFTSQWGKLVEAIIAPSCLKLFKERGIDVTGIYPNVKVHHGDLQGEFDVVLRNGTEVVIVEIKTTFTKENVDDFLEKMATVREYFPEYGNKKFYGAIAAIKYDENSHRYAYKKGLFVLINKGENIVKIANDEKFMPHEF